MFQKIKSWFKKKPELVTELEELCSVTFSVTPSCEVSVAMNCEPGAEQYMAATLHHVGTGQLYEFVEQAINVIKDGGTEDNKKQLSIILEGMATLAEYDVNQILEKTHVAEIDKPLIGPSDVYTKSEL